MESNIGKSEGQIMAEVMTDWVNRHSQQDYIDFCDHMKREHRTLQQNFMRLVVCWLGTCADPNYQTDLRNQRTKELAQEIFAKVEDTHLPRI